MSICCALVQRFERAVKSGNLALVNMITKEIRSDMGSFRPVDLVNVAKIGQSENLTTAVYKECDRRNFSKFKSQDFTVLAGLGLGREISLLRAIATRLTNIRTNDLCFILWKVENEILNVKGFEELANRDLTKLSQTNLTQLIRAITRTTQIVPVTLVRNVANTLTNRLPDTDSKIFPFLLYSVCEIMSKTSHAELRSSLEMENFFTTVNAQLRDRSADMSPLDFVDSVRALGRIRKLDREVFVEIFMPKILPKLDKSDLSETRIKGIQNAAVSVGINSFSF